MANPCCRAASVLVATLPLLFGAACANTEGAGAGGTGGSGSGGATTGSGGALGSGGATTGSGGSDGSGGAGSGGAVTGDNDGSVQETASDAPAADTGAVADPGKEGDGRFMINRPPTPPEASGRLPGVMAGTMQSLQIPAAGGFSGRSIQVYTPAGYKAGTPIAFMVFHDGGNDLNTPVIMDNLASQKKMPPMVGIYIPPVDRSREYDTVNDNFTKYITGTVLPAVEARNITLTKDPEASGACGHSSGGILAFTMAWFEPERYRRVLTLSGSFVHLQTPGGDMYNNLVRTTMPLKPIRIAQIAGSIDANPQWVQANETMSASLQAAGYHNRYLLINGGTHNPASQNRPNMPDLLTWLWRNYPATGPTM
ncbi:MAG: hypothetical protein QOI66_1432 [Myxococcales bacterium]|jgi:enterochelin esterase family protein|nr:hypothetical protein [Myxococcales bacterium]